MSLSWCHICSSIHWNMRVLSNVNREFHLDHCINISALQKEDQIHVRKKTRKSHEQVEADIDHCIDYEKFELFWANRRNCSCCECKSSRMRNNVTANSIEF